MLYFSKRTSLKTLVCAGILFLFGCSETIKQNISSLSFQNNQITNGTLKVYSFGKGKKGSLLKSFDLSKEKADLNNVDASGEDLLLELSDFEYTDLYTDKKISMTGSDTWQSILPQSYDNKLGFEINPITTLLTAYVEVLVREDGKAEETALEQALAQFNSHFGSINVLSDIPTKLVDEKLVSENEVYYISLVGFSKLATIINQSAGSGYTSKNLLHDLMKDLNDSFFEGKDKNYSIVIDHYFFDKFIMNYRLRDSIESYLKESNIDYSKVKAITKLLKSVKSLERTFFHSLPLIDIIGPEIYLVSPNEGSPVGNNYPVYINFTDASGPLKSSKVYYDNIEVTDTNGSDFTFEGSLNTVGQANGPKEFKVVATDQKNNVSTKIITVISDNTFPVVTFTYDAVVPTSNFYIGGVADLRAEITDNNDVSGVIITSNNSGMNALLVDSDNSKSVFRSLVNTSQIVANGQVSFVLSVKGSDKAGNQVSQQYNVTIDNRGPQIQLIYPLLGKTFHDGDVIEANIESTLGVLTVSGTFQIGNIIYPMTDTSTGSPNIFTHDVNLPSGVQDDEALIRFTAVDIKGNSSITDFDVFYNNNFFELIKDTTVNQGSYAEQNLKTDRYYASKNLRIGKSFSNNNAYNVFITNAYRGNGIANFGASKIMTFPINYTDKISQELQPMTQSMLNVADFGIEVGPLTGENSAVCDFNNDGIDDFAWMAYGFDNSNSSAVRVHMGSQGLDGSWPITLSVSEPGFNPSISCFDFNEDGYDDLHAMDHIYYGPSFLTETNLAAVLPTTGATGDFQQIGDIDGDGHQDYLYWYFIDIVGDFGFRAKVVYGPIFNTSFSKGNYYSSPLIDGYGGVGKMGGLGDINHDGFDDFVIYTNSPKGFRVFYGSDNRNIPFLYFNLASSNSNLAYTPPFKTCDIDGNGYQDIVFRGADPTPSYSFTKVAYILGPNFDTVGTESVGWQMTENFECKDINYDGRDDIIAYLTTTVGVANPAVAGAIVVLYDDK